MILVGPCSPRFTADTLVVSLNVGEGGPGEALRFPCALVAIVKGRRGRALCIGERGFGLVAAEKVGGEEGFGGTVTTVGAFAIRFGRPQVFSHSALHPVTNMDIDREYPNT